MTQDEKMRMKRRTDRHEFWHHLTSGVFCTSDLSVKLVFAALYLICAMVVLTYSGRIAASVDNYELLSPIMASIMTHIFLSYLVAGGIALAVMWVIPFDKKAVEADLQSIGLVNQAGIAPTLRRKIHDKSNPKITIWEFNNHNIPLDTWENKRTSIETALDLTIVKLKYSNGKQHILLYAVPAKSDLPDLLQWKDKYLSRDSFVLVLGQSFTGSVTVNLAKIPHILLGGSTGSGKSVLLKLLLMQALHKGAVVCIADFKGGVDFSPVWDEKCRMCFVEKELLPMLDMLVSVLESRKELFKGAGCPNLDEYNWAIEEHLPRYIFACDEVAEILDKTGLPKEQKSRISQIESKLSMIARQGRAFGIHLILATQRPDATIIPGQIRSNLDCRVCGRADTVLSQIILDSTAAAEQIPKDARGRFLLHDGTIFQAYWFDETTL